MNLIPNDILALILKHLPRDGTNSRMNAILTCSRWKNVYLTKVITPWTIFLIHKDTIEYCGLMAAFDVNENTVAKKYFFYWYDLFPSIFKKDFLMKYGDYFFSESCNLQDKEDKKLMVSFFLQEFMSDFTYEEISKLISNGISSILYHEDIEMAYTIFIDHCFIPIDRKILKKWCTILCYKREYPSDKDKKENRISLVKWIKHRPEMTKYLIKGKDYFYY